MILYLHGFRSSPQSFKAQMIANRLQRDGRSADYVCPQLPASPQQAMQLLERLVDGIAPADLSLIGSSLGGYYATWLAEQLACRVVLLNPAVAPIAALHDQIGVGTTYQTGLPFDFKPEYLDQLRQFEVAGITQPQRYFLIAARGDEVLDWRQMLAHYPGVQTRLLDGSDHGLSDFADYIDTVLAFCEAKPALDQGRL